jgi:hypothetical protein
MIKLIALTVFFFVQGAFFSTMPSKCFTIGHFAKCERIVGDAVLTNSSINWDTVDAVRSIR